MHMHLHVFSRSEDSGTHQMYLHMYILLYTIATSLSYSLCVIIAVLLYVWLRQKLIGYPSQLP